MIEERAVSDTQSSAPGWYRDPYHRAEHRFFDGSTWTLDVASGGRQRRESADDWANWQGTSRPDQVQAQVARATGAAHGSAGGPWAQPAQGAVVPVATGGGTLFTEPVLVVNQRAKLIEVTNEYAVFDAQGSQLGAVRQVGQSTAKKVVRVLTSYDQFFSQSFEIVDGSGAAVLRIVRPAKVFKSRFNVTDGANNVIGEIVQENVFGKIRFGLTSGGHAVGSINAENWRAWNFSIRDHVGTEVARITKTWEGLAKTMFTTADNYVVHIHRPLGQPLVALVVASALSVDTALKQDSRGFG